MCFDTKYIITIKVIAKDLYFVLKKVSVRPHHLKLLLLFSRNVEASSKMFTSQNF